MRAAILHPAAGLGEEGRATLHASHGNFAWLSTAAGAAGILLSNALPTFGALIFVAAWLAFAVFHARASVAALTRTPMLWAFPVVVLLSTLWSAAAQVTLRYALEDLFTVGAAIVAARLQPPRSLISALVSAMLVVAVASVLFGGSQVDPLSGTTSFVGLFGSKNQVGLLCTLLLLGAMAMLLDGRSGWFARALAIAGIVGTLPLLYLSRSGTSLVTACLASVLLCANLAVARLPTLVRPRVVFALVASALPLALLAGFAGDVAADFIRDVLGKDTTLTGRTLLWQHALALFPAHPIGGVGAGAFWVQDTIEAEGLWREFHVEARAGFHFHNTYLESLIELGIVGCATLSAAILTTLALCLRWSWRARDAASSLFVAVMACLLIRSFVEIDIMAPFAIGTFLFFVAATYGLDARAGRVPA